MIIRDTDINVLKDKHWIHKSQDWSDITLNKTKYESINANFVYDRTQDSNFHCDCNPGFYYNESDKNCAMAEFTTKLNYNLEK